MKQQQQQQEETFDPNKMLRKRRFLRKSMANFHFDKVLSSRNRETTKESSPTLKTRSKSNVFWNLFTTRNQMNNVNKRVVTKREKNLIKATPWLERVAAMRFFNLGMYSDNEVSPTIQVTLRMQRHIQYSVRH